MVSCCPGSLVSSRGEHHYVGVPLPSSAQDAEHIFAGSADDDWVSVPTAVVAPFLSGLVVCAINALRVVLINDRLYWMSLVQLSEL